MPRWSHTLKTHKHRRSWDERTQSRIRMVRTRTLPGNQAVKVAKVVEKAKTKAKTKAAPVKETYRKHTTSKKKTKRETKQRVSKTQMRIKILDIMTPLSTAMVVSRPSTRIKTPYIADVLPLDVHGSSSSSSSVLNEFQDTINSLLLDTTSPSPMKSMKKSYSKDLLKEASKTFCSKYADELLLAHAPSLDCAGMVISGSRVYTSVSTSSTAKSDCVIQFCEELREDGSYTKVGYHPFLAERISEELLNKHLIEEIASYDTILKQQTFGKSRVDFVLSDSNTKSKTITLLEVKNVVGADYPKGGVPSRRSPVGVYETLAPSDKMYERSAIFPHGSVKPGIGVVSDRAIKHIHELTKLHGTIDKASNKRINSAVLFIVNRGDCAKFRPCHEACMLFSQVLQRAVKKGVLVIAKEVIWDETIAYLGKSLPVVFDDTVDESIIDEKHLKAVLDFNENGGIS